MINFYGDLGHFRYETVEAVILSAAFWTSLYFTLRYFLAGKSSDYCERINSFIHGFVGFFLGIDQCFVPDVSFTNPEWKTSYIQSFILVFSLGYFIFDTGHMLAHNFKDEKVMLFHHLYCMFALLMILFKGYSGAQTTCGVGSMEITNSFLQARWFVRTAGYYPSILYTALDITYLLVFILVRIIFGTYYMWVIATHPKNDWDFILLAFTVYLISWIFVYEIVEYISRKYVRRREQRPA